MTTGGINTQEVTANQMPAQTNKYPAYSNYGAVNDSAHYKDKTVNHYTKVLMIKNLPETDNYQEQITYLFHLFGNYGNVQKVKILYKNRSNVLIEFEDAE